MNRNQDPTLEELLADPVIALVMRSDGYTGAQIRRIAYEARKRLAAPEGERDERQRYRLPRPPWRAETRHEADIACLCS